MTHSGSLPGLLSELEALDSKLMSVEYNDNWTEAMERRMMVLRAVFAHPDIARCAETTPQRLTAMDKRQQQLWQHFQARREALGQQLQQLEQGRQAIQAYLSE